MTIDLERLAVDADYWCAVAPYGASHLIDGDRFVKWVNGAEYELYPYDDENNWEPANCSYSLSEYFQGTMWKVIARPMHWPAPKSHPTDTQPAESGAQISLEWVNGIPPIGWHGECTWGNKEAWPECVILTNGKIAIERYENWSFSTISDYREIEFRPIRSHAERERDDLARALLDDLDDLELNISGNTATRIADGIIAAGWYKEGLA
jgi:hypothetical protein